jgi:hypothetical protein
VVLFSVTFCSSGFEGMAVAGVPRWWRGHSPMSSPWLL